MDASEELELVPPEYRHVHKPKVHLPPSDIHMVGGWGSTASVPVYVTFYTDFDKKVVETRLGHKDFLADLTRKANELFPGHKWRLFSGTQHHADYEFLNGRMVSRAIKEPHHWDFHYLIVHLKPADTTFVTCDSCRQSIHGHRFKCTECADFDICGKCEARSIHSEHAMLRIVNSRTYIPGYITDTAPRDVFTKSQA